MSTPLKRILATLALSAAATASALAQPAPQCGSPHANSCGCQQTDPLAGAALYDDAVQYHSFGVHRTATKGDLDTAQWVSKLLTKCTGFDVKLQTWPTRQFMPKETKLSFGSTDSVAAFPVWWPKPTTKEGVTGPLASSIDNVQGKIYYYTNLSAATFSVTSTLTGVINSAAANGAVGVVIVTVLNQPDTVASSRFIGLNNPAASQTAWPVPVVTVGRADKARLDAAVTTGEVATLVSTGDYVDASGKNVVAVLDRGPSAPVMVVSTPLSGWFGAAGERGGGVAMFLGLARWASTAKSHVTWIFVGTSGHEIHELGLRFFLASAMAPSPANTAAWVHLGAWQAMYSYVLQGGQLVATTDLDTRLMQYVGTTSDAVLANFSDAGLKLQLSPSIAFGDLVVIAQAGYANLLGITYSHEFHHASDDTPVLIGPDILEPTARAYQSTLRQIVGE